MAPRYQLDLEVPPLDWWLFVIDRLFGLPSLQDLIITPLWATAGWTAGLYLGRLAYQLPRDEPFRFTPLCSACTARIPLIQLPLRVHCRTCGAALSYDRLEWPLGAIFALLALVFGPTGTLLAYSFDSIVLLISATIDLRHRYVYAIIVYPGLVGAAILSPALTGIGWVSTILGIVAGSTVFGIFYVAGRLIYRGGEPLGKGDIELAALAGAMVGFPRVINALIYGSMVNAAVILTMLALRRLGKRDFIAYGPGLCAGTLITFFATS
ncbi:MAG: Prepilin peptidase [Chloroflexi bacterium]|nr:Prepilin peptidase [Chloroflexota bacterium]